MISAQQLDALDAAIAGAISMAVALHLAGIRRGLVLAHRKNKPMRCTNVDSSSVSSRNCIRARLDQAGHS